MLTEIDDFSRVKSVQIMQDAIKHHMTHHKTEKLYSE